MKLFVLPIFDGVIMDGHHFLSLASTTQNIGCPSIMTPSKMGKTKNLIFYSLSEYFVQGNFERTQFSQEHWYLQDLNLQSLALQVRYLLLIFELTWLLYSKAQVRTRSLSMSGEPLYNFERLHSHKLNYNLIRSYATVGS